jgi:hypothetical protein
MNEYLARMETQLKKWDSDLDALAAEGEKAGAAARAAYQERVKDLRANRDAAQKTFLELQGRMKHAWETLQAALEKAAADLRK